MAAFCCLDFYRPPCLMYVSVDNPLLSQRSHAFIDIVPFECSFEWEPYCSLLVQGWLYSIAVHFNSLTIIHLKHFVLCLFTMALMDGMQKIFLWLNAHLSFLHSKHSFSGWLEVAAFPNHYNMSLPTSHMKWVLQTVTSNTRLMCFQNHHYSHFCSVARPDMHLETDGNTAFPSWCGYLADFEEVTKLPAALSAASGGQPVHRHNHSSSWWWGYRVSIKVL